MNARELSFLFTLLLFPTGQILRLQFPHDINVSVFDISVIFTGILWFSSLFRGERKYQKYTLTKPILLFFLTMLISLAANVFRYSWTELGVASLYAVRWLTVSSLYFLLKETEKDFRERIPSYMILAGAVVVLLGYIQYFFYADLRNLYYLGWDEHYLRMFSSFLDPNFAGAFFVLYFLFLLGQISFSGSTGSSFRNVSSIFMACATFIAIFLTTSRSAFLMLAIGLITYLILVGKKKWILLFVGVSVCILLFASRFYYIENINPFRVASSVARVETAMNAVRIISENPIFGVGFNAYRYVQYEYGFRQQDPMYPNHADSGTDNSFLFVFATTGIIGLSAFLYLLYSMYRTGQSEGKGIMGKVLIASICALIVDSLFINSLFYPLLWYWCMLLVGITDYT